MTDLASHRARLILKVEPIDDSLRLRIGRANQHTQKCRNFQQVPHDQIGLINWIGLINQIGLINFHNRLLEQYVSRLVSPSRETLTISSKQPSTLKCANDLRT